MNPFDLTIRHGTVVTSTDSFRADVGIREGRVAAIEESLAPGIEDVDARDRLVLPGGVDSHCHIEQLSSFGIRCADDFHSATVSAAFGGTTTVIPFCAQHRGDALPVVLADYAERARTKAVIDYGFHLIVGEPRRAHARHRPAGRDQARHTFVQDLHDLRTHHASRRADPGRARGRATARRPGHGSRGKPRHHLLARRTE